MFNIAEKFWTWKQFNKEYTKYRVKAWLGLAGSLRNESADHAAGKVFIQSHQSGVKSKRIDHYNMKIEFNDGSEFTLWVANKMYAYGSGIYKTPDGQINHINGLLPKWVNLVALEIERS